MSSAPARERGSPKDFRAKALGKKGQMQTSIQKENLMKLLSNSKFIKIFTLAAGILLLLAAGLVLIFDPFYHYHGSLPGLKAVVTKSEYQCIGTIRNFDYDSVLCGSSTAENYNNHWFDELFGAKTVKAIKSSGTTADLKFYLDEAFETHEIKNIYYSLDLFALDGDPDVNFVNDSMPLYLFDKNPFNDVKYLWNKDVIFEDIPYLIAMNLAGGYDEGTSYNWWQYKTFSKEDTLSHYSRSDEVTSELEKSEYTDRVDKNVGILTEMVENNSDTKFYFMLPPYSMLWWDSVYRSGQLEEYLYARSQIMEWLLPYENVKIYDFQNDSDIILNLDNYMDPVHFSADVNHLMALECSDENSVYRVTMENKDQKLADMENLANQIMEVEILKYYKAKE